MQVVAAVIRHHGRYLICRRPRGGSAPGKWEFPGGKVHPDETPPAALARELREELGIAARVGPPLLRHTHVQDTACPIHLHFYDVEIVSGEPTLLHHEELRWATPEELRALDLLEADRALLAHLSAPPR